MLILIAVGFAFSEGRVVLEIDFEENGGEEGTQLDGTAQNRAHARPNGSLGANAEESRGASVSRTAPNGASVDDADATAEKADPIAAFASAHDLSPREREVAALWLTGHGLKYIENALFISATRTTAPRSSRFSSRKTASPDPSRPRAQFEPAPIAPHHARARPSPIVPRPLSNSRPRSVRMRISVAPLVSTVFAPLRRFRATSARAPRRASPAATHPAASRRALARARRATGTTPDGRKPCKRGHRRSCSPSQARKAWPLRC